MKAPTIVRKYFHIIYGLLFAIIVGLSGLAIVRQQRSSVLINEVCTSNVSCCEDADGKYPDWIELFNPTDEIVDLSGYVINKSADLQKDKFVIPDGTVIAPGAFYLFNPGFVLSSEGCVLNLVDKRGQYKDHVSVPALKHDTTYSRFDDGSYVWEVKVPTPGYENSEGDTLGRLIEGEVLASAQPGFYDNGFDLTLKPSNWGRRVYYTVDGSDPVKYGLLYDKPVHIYDRSSEKNVYSVIPDVSLDYIEGNATPPQYTLDKCMVVRAVSKDLLGRYTDINTFTYFIGFDQKTAYDDINVVSISADPDDLFSYENGIMVLGKNYDEYDKAGQPEDYEGDNSNFTVRGRRSERDICLEIYDSDRNRVLSGNAGMRIKGLSSRWDVQKSFSVFFRKAYGSNYKEKFSLDGIDFDLHSFALDKCGQDTSTKMVDTIMSNCMSKTGCATAKRVPCCLFLNGEYWGFYWISERFDASFLADRYGVNADCVEYMDWDDIDNWDPEFFDRDSLIDYYASNIIVAHRGDWPPFNFRFWRTVTEDETEFGDGKYRPVIFDMNSSSMMTPDYNSFEVLMSVYPFQNVVEEDERFAEDLVSRIDSMSKNEFSPDKVLPMINLLYDRMKEQMILDRMRYSNCSAEEAEEYFEEGVSSIRKFFRDRYDYLKIYEGKYLDGK